MMAKRKTKPASGILAKFTLERIARPPGTRRHLVITDDGGFGWGDDETTFLTFADGEDAERFREHRLLEHGADAVVARHTVH